MGIFCPYVHKRPSSPHQGFLKGGIMALLEAKTTKIPGVTVLKNVAFLQLGEQSELCLSSNERQMAKITALDPKVEIM